ncbi:S-adenosyl-L-methionine-dependent methyltransferase superfamily protein [Forsythia ovata]|uniref:S-adenosyl-L-methionine-dependent methyltransferase superfamily protein n=1 Tax=Forsythia ovata TaxID=205694 RepID=A0ABD1SJ84_9LAMI
MDIALFSPSSLFAGSDGNSSEEENTETHQKFEERRHQFPGMELLVREFSFHQLNANLLWPGTFAFVEWLVQHRSWIDGRRTIELGRCMPTSRTSIPNELETQNRERGRVTLLYRV